MSLSYEESTNRKRIVILGGGFGGAYCAQVLEKYADKIGAKILLIDKRNYFIFYPLLTEAGTGSLEPRHAVVAIRDFLRKTKFLMAEVTEVDPERRVVIGRVPNTDIEHRIQYDHLVIGVGSVTRMLPNLPGLEQHGFELKSIGDSVALRDRALQMLEIASSINDPDKRRELLHFVVVGGNYTGVEFAGEFQAFLNTAAKKSYKNLDRREIKVTLIEMLPKILPVLDDSLSEFATQELRSRSVDVRTSMTVKEIHADHIILKDDTVLRTRTLVWCAGIAPNPLLQRLPFTRDQRGYLVCDETGRVKDFDNVWSIGDCAVNPDPEGNPYPPTAQHATRQGKALAKNLVRVLQGQKPEPIRIKALGTLAAYGCYSAVAKVFGIRLSGFPAWFMWRTVYLSKMPTFSRKLRVALDWTADLLIRKDVVQLGVHRPERPRNYIAAQHLEERERMITGEEKHGGEPIYHDGQEAGPKADNRRRRGSAVHRLR